MKQSPIFARTYDFVAWLIPLTIKFPRSQRFVMAAALQRESLRFQELLIEASHQNQRATRLSPRTPNWTRSARTCACRWIWD